MFTTFTTTTTSIRRNADLVHAQRVEADRKAGERPASPHRRAVVALGLYGAVIVVLGGVIISAGLLVVGLVVTAEGLLRWAEAIGVSRASTVWRKVTKVHCIMSAVAAALSGRFGILGLGINVFIIRSLDD